MKFDNKLIFFLGEVSAFEIRAQVVDPPETAALAAAEESGGLGEGAPATFAVGSDVSDKPFVFFFSPSALVGVSFLTARRPSHNRPLQTRTRIATCFLQSSFELRFLYFLSISVFVSRVEYCMLVVDGVEVLGVGWK